MNGRDRGQHCGRRACEALHDNTYYQSHKMALTKAVEQNEGCCTDATEVPKG